MRVTATRAGGRHHDVSVAVAVPFPCLTLTGLTLAQFALACKGQFTFAFASNDVAVAITPQRSEAEGLLPAAFVRVKFCLEAAHIFLVLLSNLAMLRFEVVQRLADDVELVDLACDWQAAKLCEFVCLAL